MKGKDLYIHKYTYTNLSLQENGNGFSEVPSRENGSPIKSSSPSLEDADVGGDAGNAKKPISDAIFKEDEDEELEEDAKKLTQNEKEASTAQE